jgi:leader peptidase (prepilin peptidase) / N-methyltransferase
LPHLVYIIFVFALGACVGSFLNVVVWRLPRGESLITPPSHCPKCNRQLKWYDNIPILGWVKLAGKCRYCKEPISPRYPIVEAITAILFAFYYVAFYVLQWRTCSPGLSGEWVLANTWPIYALYMILLSGLLASSLIDAELFIIPVQIPWIIAIVAFFLHAIADRPWIPGSLNLLGDFGHASAALSAGAAAGLGLSIILWFADLMPTSFPKGEPLLEVDRIAIEAEINRAKLAGEKIEEEPLPPPYTPKEIRAEIRKEMLFLFPPMILGGACMAITTYFPSIHAAWSNLLRYDWLSGLLGSLLGAMVGGFIVWLTRILGTIAFRRVAMGLGDVHLMFGVGAVIGGFGATIAFFIAPFFGILIAIYMLVTRKGREMPLGPYLSLATAVVMLFYCPIAAYLTPGLTGLSMMLGELLGGKL